MHKIHTFWIGNLFQITRRYSQDLALVYPENRGFRQPGGGHGDRQRHDFRPIFLARRKDLVADVHTENTA
jgi:hypothetical protein